MPGRLLRLHSLAAFAIAALTLVNPDLAMAGLGQPTPWQKGMQEPATEIAREIYRFHDMLLIIITVITLFVLALLSWVIFRYNEKANPQPAKTSHNSVLEVAWTIIPVFILLFIAIPSFRLLYKQYDAPKADVVIKAIGLQWKWAYEYPDLGAKFESNMMTDQDLGEAAKKGLKPVRLLSVDEEIVVPAGKNIHMLVSAGDVIHNWTIPSFGVKVDAVPGRTLLAWFKAPEKAGVYYGQCSELCGTNHAFMPIAVRVVAQADYDKWAGLQKTASTEKDRAKKRAILKQAKDLIEAIAKSQAKLNEATPTQTAAR
ncbi:MAG: cytochrome c oxidase subunit II [Hyphomicrobiaceae bacterium]|nr:MAG: cytochrome c oxidase subunit II [Hyphomicrobiaceae bacterium]